MTIKNIVPFVMRGCFQNAGQNRVGSERVLKAKVEDFLSLIVAKVQALQECIRLACTSIGGADGSFDIGSMTMPRQMEVMQSLVDDIVAKSAILHCGGKSNPKLDGQFF
jgi:acyl-CoA reductase-like NAD-dependent aldehyde dehydrogenase